MSLTKKVIKPLAKGLLIPLVLTAQASGTDPAIQKKRFGSGMATLIMSNEVTIIVKIVNYLRNLVYWEKRVAKKLKNEAKDQKGGCLII